jgi:hypothetical protein
MQLSNSRNELNPFDLSDASSTQLSPGSKPRDHKQKRQQISPAAKSAAAPSVDERCIEGDIRGVNSRFHFFDGCVTLFLPSLWRNSAPELGKLLISLARLRHTVILSRPNFFRALLFSAGMAECRPIVAGKARCLVRARVILYITNSAIASSPQLNRAGLVRQHRDSRGNRPNIGLRPTSAQLIRG